MIDKIRQIFCKHEWYEYVGITRGSVNITMIEHMKICKKCNRIKRQTHFTG